MSEARTTSRSIDAGSSLPSAYTRGRVYQITATGVVYIDDGNMWVQLPGARLIVGSTVIDSGTNGRVFYQASGVLSQSANFLYDGLTLSVKATNLAQTDDIFQAIRYDGAVALRVDDDTSVTIGGSYDATNFKHAKMHTVQYARDTYANSGLLLSDLTSGSKVRLHSFGNGLFLTDDTGANAKLTLGIRENPSDATQFIASSGHWYTTGSLFGINGASDGAHLQVTSTGTHQRWKRDASNYVDFYVSAAGKGTFNAVGAGAGIEFLDIITVRSTTEQARFEYDASNYYKTTVGSAGITTFDAVGASAKFVFSDAVEVPDVAYDVTSWNASVAVPTRNALRDHFVAMGWVKNEAKNSSPGTGDDNTAGYAANSLWTDTSGGYVWICSDATTGAAVWTRIV